MASVGQGQAIVLDNPRDPISIYMAGEQRKAQNAYRQQQLGLTKQRQDNTQIKDLLSYKYDKPEEKFVQWGQNEITNNTNEVFNILQNNPGVDIQQLAPQIRQAQGRTNTRLGKASEVVSLFKEKQQSINSLKNVDKDMATAILNHTIAKNDPHEVDTDLLQNIEQVPAIYDLNGLVADSVSSVKDQYKNTDIGAIQNSPLGQFIEVTDHKMRFKDIDKTMDYILRGNDVTDEGIAQKAQGGVISDRIRYNIAQSEVQAKGGDPNDVTQVMPRFKEIQYDSKYAPKVREQLRGVLDQLNQEERDVTIHSMGKFKQPSAKEIDYTNAKARREEALDAVTSPFGKNGELSQPSPKASESLGKLRGGDFAGGKIIDAKFERGGYTIAPEWMAKLSPVINTPEGYEVLREAVKHLVPVKGNGNKIKFTTKTGTMFGSPETQVDVPLDLSNPDAKVIINALMNQNAGERKVYYDDLYQKSGSPTVLDLDSEEDDDDGFLDD
jgi:hypothetical protein